MLNIVERNTSGESWGNAFADIGKTFADAYTKKKEEEKKLDQADASTKGYLKSMATFGKIPQEEADALIKGDPTKNKIQNIFARQGRIEEINAGNVFAKQQAEMNESIARANAYNRQNTKPNPGTNGYRQETLPNGGVITRDGATGEPIPTSQIGRNEPKPGEGRVGSMEALENGGFRFWNSEGSATYIKPEGDSPERGRIGVAKWISEQREKAANGDQRALADLQAFDIAYPQAEDPFGKRGAASGITPVIPKSNPADQEFIDPILPTTKPPQSKSRIFNLTPVTNSTKK